MGEKAFSRECLESAYLQLPYYYCSTFNTTPYYCSTTSIVPRQGRAARTQNLRTYVLHQITLRINGRSHGRLQVAPVSGAAKHRS
jgi:hypothetical protein